MIVKFYRSGSSFKGLAQYLTHDVGAETSNRVAWTHTLNCVNEDVPSAVNELLWTYRSADLLKEEAGIRAGGRHVEDALKHASLNWHPSERPPRGHMIAMTKSLVEHMGWSEHEAILVAHQDKEHCHVHIMLNRVSPIDGTVLDESFEYRRAQEWAKQYEIEQGRVFCTQRLLPEEERTPSPTRASWEALRDSEQQHEVAENIRRKFDSEYFAREENSKIIQGEEWKILKAHQREEREAHFSEGKEAFSEVRKEAYLDTRELFRPEWRDYFKATKADRLDADALTEIKQDILARQEKTLREYGDEYTRLLREERDGAYRELLDAQREERGGLTVRQAEGLHSPHLLDHVNENLQGEGTNIRDAFGQAAFEVTGPNYQRTADIPEDRLDGSAGGYLELPEISRVTSAENSRARDGADMTVDLGSGLIGGFAKLGEALFDGFLGGDAPKLRPEPTPSAPPPRKEHWESVRDNPFMRVAEAARQEAIRQEEEKRSRAWDDRDRARGWD